MKNMRVWMENPHLLKHMF